MNSPTLLAIEIGGSKLQLCAGSAEGVIHERVKFKVDRAAGSAGIRLQIESALTRLVPKWKPAAIGIGYGGPVDWRTGRIVKSYHIAGWDGFELASWVTALAGCPAFAENDTNAAAFGEALNGAGRGRNPVYYTNIGSGVGGGLVVDGRLYHGAPPGEAETGHLRLERDNTIVEDRCSGWAIDRRIRREITAAPECLLARLVGDAPPGGEALHLSAALAQGDALAHTILRDAMREFSFALSHVTHLLHPEVIVVGGGLASIGEPVRSEIAQSLPGFLMDAFLPGPEVLLTKLGEDAVPVGALALAAYRLEQSAFS